MMPMTAQNAQVSGCVVRRDYVIPNRTDEKRWPTFCVLTESCCSIRNTRLDLGEMNVQLIANVENQHRA